jgi:hypothetical protein
VVECGFAIPPFFFGRVLMSSRKWLHGVLPVEMAMRVSLILLWGIASPASLRNTTAVFAVGVSSHCLITPR